MGLGLPYNHLKNCCFSYNWLTLVDSSQERAGQKLGTNWNHASSRMSGNHVTSKLHKYLASQTFMASYPVLDSQACLGSILLWFLIFRCKFTKLYFFLTLTFHNPICAMARMKVLNCHEKLFSDSLCQNHAISTLMIMFVMDLVLFFLNMFLW
jgi:1,3-beta-glucan synthase